MVNLPSVGILIVVNVVLIKKNIRGVYCGNRMLLWLCEEYRGPPVDWSTVSVDDFNHLMDTIRYALEKYITGNK